MYVSAESRTRAECSEISQPPPRARPKGAATTGMSAYLSPMFAFWNCRMDRPRIVPLALLGGQEDEHEVGPGGELLALVADHEGVEVGPPLLDRGLQHGEGIGAEGVHLGVELDEPAAVTQVQEAGPGVLLEDGAALREDGEVEDPRAVGQGGDPAGTEDRGPPADRFVEALPARGQELFHERGNGASGGATSLGHRGHPSASRSRNGPRPQA